MRSTENRSPACRKPNASTLAGSSTTAATRADDGPRRHDATISATISCGPENSASTLPIVLGGAPEEMSDLDYLAQKRVRIALQGHAPIAAATQAVYETLKALREGLPPKDLKRLAPSELTNKVTRETDVKARLTEFLGLKR